MSNPINRKQWFRLTIKTLGAFALAHCSPGKSMTNRQPLENDLRKIGSAKKKDVLIGIQSYSFKDRILENAIKAMQEIGIVSCELWHGHTEPRDIILNPAKIREWRKSATMIHFENVRKQFETANIKIQAYTVNFNDEITDAELDFIFNSVITLKTSVLTTSCTVSVLKRVDLYARKYNVLVGIHNHSKVDEPNEISGPESFLRGMQAKSEYIGINLDIGHFTAANYDCVKFIQQHHDKIRCIHLKDRIRNQGPATPFGEGDAPIKEVLQLIKKNNWPIPANIEYEYKGIDTVNEIKKNLDFCKKALAD